MSLIIPFIILPIGAFWLWMYRDMTKNIDLTDKEKDNWTLYFIIMNIFTAILYYFYVYRRRN